MVKIRSRARAGFALALSTVLFACAAPAPYPGGPPVVDRSVPAEGPRPDDATAPGVSVYPYEPSRIDERPASWQVEPHADTATSANRAVVALLDDADRQQDAGDLEQAAAALERALRIEPQNAVIWHRLARVRLAQGQWDQAESLAQRSNSLAAGDADLERRNWNLIAQARQARGDAAGSRAARARAAALEGSR